MTIVAAPTVTKGGGVAAARIRGAWFEKDSFVHIRHKEKR